MPVSHYRHIGSVMSAVEQYPSASSILDIGPGFGKYGVLIRERWDVRYLRYHKESWKLRLDCLEIWPKYISPLHTHIYNNIYLGDAFDLIDDLPQYDTIIALEILEHMKKERGIEFLKKIVQKSNHLLLISFPQTFQKGFGSNWPNPYEEHHCLWTKLELDSIIGPTTAHSKTVFSRLL